jgi:hypothetical protein
MRRFLATIIRGYGWRLGAIAATATVAALARVFA